LLHKAVKVVV